MISTEKTQKNEFQLISLDNKKGLKVDFTNFGATMINIIVKDKNGNDTDVCLGYDNPEDYINTKAEFGAIIGRFSNRIAKGKFNIDGTEYSLAINNGVNHLHGGNVGYNKLFWDIAEVRYEDEPYVIFTLFDEDMRENYPGNVNVSVKYTLKSDNSIAIEYTASTDKSTYINLTNHCYFNLDGEGSGDILNQYLQINADYYTPIDETSIPTGEIAPVKGTVMDFTTPKKIGRDINDGFIQIVNGSGFDHNFVMGDSGKMKHAATAYSEMSGIKLSVYTDKPGIQLYAGNFLDVNCGKNGHTYGKRHAFCLETQFYPDSPNQKNFPETLVTPQDEYHFTTIYKFGLIGD